MYRRFSSRWIELIPCCFFLILNLAVWTNATQAQNTTTSETTVASTSTNIQEATDPLPIRPWPANPWYWSYHGQPVLLLGGSDDDNLFQWLADKLIPQLDRIVAAGGNVVRNTMSDRKDGGWEVYAFAKNENGQYDLNQWNPEYWERLERFLVETHKRQIFVQIEVWDRFDYTDDRGNAPRRWQDHPYNPANNINYTKQETGLELRYPDHPGANNQPFFFSTPNQRDIQPLLRIQQAFVDKLLEHSLKYDHVLYCIDNETSAEPAWGEYWSDWIQKRAKEKQKDVYITEMWDDWDLHSQQHRHTFDHPERYAFVDVSQNNHNKGQQHWNNFVDVRQMLQQQPRPMNTTKTYGADGNKFGHSDQDAIERFWRHLLAGAASIRFHRPDSGLGINDKAVACIQAARRVSVNVPAWNLSPASNQLGNRSDNECFAAATENDSTIVFFFPAAEKEDAVRSVTWESNHSTNDAQWKVTWIDIDQGNVHSVSQHSGLIFSPPAAGNFAAVATKSNQPMLSGKRFQVAGRNAFMFLPEPAKENPDSAVPQPWVMYAPTLLPDYPDEHERWMHQQFLNAGISVAGIDVGEGYGSPKTVEAMEALYQHMTAVENFERQLVVLGRSRGGLWVSSWAAEHPERILGLAGIYPVFDLQTYPGIQQASAAYQLNPQDLEGRLRELNPIYKSQSLANASIPVFIIHGTDDNVVPIKSNSEALQQMYRKAGHAESFQLEAVAGQGHNFWPGFFRSQKLVDFVINRSRNTTKQ